MHSPSYDDTEAPGKLRSDSDAQVAEYETHFRTWPGMFALFYKHPGFREWFCKREVGDTVCAKVGCDFGSWFKDALCSDQGYTTTAPDAEYQYQ